MTIENLVEISKIIGIPVGLGGLGVFLLLRAREIQEHFVNRYDNIREVRESVPSFMREWAHAYVRSRTQLWSIRLFGVVLILVSLGFLTSIAILLFQLSR